MQASSGKWAMLATLHLHSQVIEHDESSRLRDDLSSIARAVSGMLIQVTQPWSSKLILAF